MRKKALPVDGQPSLEMFEIIADLVEGAAITFFSPNNG